MGTMDSLNTLTPDRALVERFVTLLAGTGPVTWQTFHSDQTDTLTEHVFPANFSGTVEQVWGRLVEAQRKGGAVSIVINAGAEGSARAADMHYPRALVLDLDGCTLTAREVMEKFRACPPTVLVKSRSGFHAYWLLIPPRPDFDAWWSAQKALADHFGGDPAMCRPNVQLRCPGTWNTKDPANPVLVRPAFHPKVPRYTADQVLGAFGLTPVPRPPKREPRPLTGDLGVAVSRWMEDHADEYLSDLPANTGTRITCPSCGAKNACGASGEPGKAICWSPNHEVGTVLADGSHLFSALDMARGSTPLPVFLRQQTDDDGEPYLANEADSIVEDLIAHPWGPDAATPAVTAPEGGKAEVSNCRPLSSYERRPIEWRVPGWVVSGSLHGIYGEKGAGKTSLLIDAMACWTTGRGWLGGPAQPPAKCLLIAPEDDVETTLRSRFEAAGGDLDNVIIWRDGEAPMLPAAYQAIEAAVRNIGIEYIVIDAILSCFGELNSHKDQDTRQVLVPLKEMLARTKATGFVVGHLNKNEGASAANRAMGSRAFTGVPRLCWTVARDTDSGDFTMARLAGNVGAAPSSRSYRIMSRSGSPTDADTFIAWGGESDKTATELLAKPERDAGRPPKQRQAAEFFLQGELLNGPAAKKAVLAAGELRGFSASTIERAAKTLNIVSASGMWSLPTTSMN